MKLVTFSLTVEVLIYCEIIQQRGMHASQLLILEWMVVFSLPK